MLALLALGEVERGLYGAFVANFVESKGQDYLSSHMASPGALAAKLGKAFIVWIELKSTTSTDEVFCCCVNYMKLTRMYKLFCVSVRNGDAIMVEYLYEYFIPIWLMTSNHNYVEIALTQIEALYGRVPFHVLQSTRENQMQSIHAGNDRDGRPMAQWAMDALMELLQIKYKAMDFPNSREGWQNNLTNMPLVSQAKIFCATEYT